MRSSQTGHNWRVLIPAFKPEPHWETLHLPVIETLTGILSVGFDHPLIQLYVENHCEIGSIPGNRKNVPDVLVRPPIMGKLTDDAAMVPVYKFKIHGGQTRMVIATDPEGPYVDLVEEK